MRTMTPGIEALRPPCALQAGVPLSSWHRGGTSFHGISVGSLLVQGAARHGLYNTGALSLTGAVGARLTSPGTLWVSGAGRCAPAER